MASTMATSGALDLMEACDYWLREGRRRATAEAGADECYQKIIDATATDDPALTEIRCSALVALADLKAARNNFGEAIELLERAGEPETSRRFVVCRIKAAIGVHVCVRACVRACARAWTCMWTRA